MNSTQPHSPPRTRRVDTAFPSASLSNGLSGLDIDLSLDDVRTSSIGDEEYLHPVDETARPTTLARVISSGVDAELAHPDGRNDAFSAVLSGVPFHELSEGDVSSDENDDAHAGGNNESDSDSDWSGIHLTRARSDSPRAFPPSPAVPPPHLSSRSAKCADCDMCSRLAAENRSLRRRLDEMELRAVEAELIRRDSVRESDSGRPPSGRESRSSNASSAAASKGSSWGRIASRASFSGFSTKKRPSEKARLRSEVRALAVTAEYLWRKLSATERELAEVRAADVAGARVEKWEDNFDDLLEAKRIDPAALAERKL